MSSTASFDFVIVGGGIVGLATAYRLSQQYSDARILLLEKEHDVARHQSGRNSGVAHSGIYYKPGSLKSITCREGKLALEQFCLSNEIRYETCGKIIVATNEFEEGRLKSMFERGKTAGVECRWIDSYEIRQLEPHAAGVAAVHVPQAGIVDYPGVCNRLKNILLEQGHSIDFGQSIVRMKPSKDQVELWTRRGDRYVASFLITCGGLYSDHLAKMAGWQPPARIIPFRGEYYKLKEHRKSLCRNLIYPVPDPAFPFLGVHFTRMVDGSVECGPNAVLALSREGYAWTGIRLGELFHSISYPGLQRLMWKHWRSGLGEIKRSLIKRAFVQALQRLVPEIKPSDVVPFRSGVRAQAIASDGSMIDDFLWVGRGRVLHVCNAPSPAATASLEIGKQIVQRARHQMDSTD